MITFLELSVPFLEQLQKVLRSIFAVSPTTLSLLATGRKNLRWSCSFNKLNNDQNFVHFFHHYVSSHFQFPWRHSVCDKCIQNPTYNKRKHAHIQNTNIYTGWSIIHHIVLNMCIHPVKDSVHFELCKRYLLFCLTSTSLFVYLFSCSIILILLGETNAVHSQSVCFECGESCCPEPEMGIWHTQPISIPQSLDHSYWLWRSHVTQASPMRALPKFLKGPI